MVDWSSLFTDYSKQLVQSIGSGNTTYCRLSGTHGLQSLRCTPHLTANSTNGQHIYLPQTYPDMPEQDMFIPNLLDIGGESDHEVNTMYISTGLWVHWSYSLGTIDSLCVSNKLAIPRSVFLSASHPRVERYTPLSMVWRDPDYWQHELISREP